VAELSRRLARRDDEAEIAQVLAGAVQKLAPVERTWVLLLRENAGELSEAVRWPDPAAGARMSVGAEALARLELGAARAGVVLQKGDALLDGLAPGERDASLCLFAPRGRGSEPLIVLVVAAKGGERLAVAARAALQICADAAGHALERRRLAARIELYRSDAERDFLTGIFNRRLTMRLLEREIRKSQRTQSPLSLVMIDVDNFKSLNDAYGHLAGDEVLRALAWLFATTGRSTDVVGRFGGEEFLLILPDTPVEHAVIFAERLRQDVERFGREQLKHLRDHLPTISIGVCAVGTADTTESAISRADKALYESKRRGRNCFSLGLPEEDRS
jgi:diguanylate cyclase (GGDEF)-like protein